MTASDVVAVAVAALIGAAIVIAALPFIARRDPVPPVPRRAMRQLEARQDHDPGDGTS